MNRLRDLYHRHISFIPVGAVGLFCAFVLAFLIADRVIAGIQQCRIAPVEGCPR